MVNVPPPDCLVFCVGSDSPSPFGFLLAECSGKKAPSLGIVEVGLPFFFPPFLPSSGGSETYLSVGDCECSCYTGGFFFFSLFFFPCEPVDFLKLVISDVPPKLFSPKLVLLE